MDWDTPGLPMDEATFNLVTIRDISMIDSGVRCDFVGIVLKVGKIFSFKNKRGENVSRVNIQLGDSDLHSLNLCLWGDRLVSEFE